MKRGALTWVGLGLVLLALAVASVALGTVRVPLGHSLRALFGVGSPDTVTIVRVLRAPRLVLAMLLGAGLGLSANW
ncbi:MAG: hypothetical protein B7Z72_08195, partial [Gemmatimonadetes bacterium 21-71-4]